MGASFFLRSSKEMVSLGHSSDEYFKTDARPHLVQYLGACDFEAETSQ